MKRLSITLLVSCALAAFPIGAQSTVDPVGDSTLVNSVVLERSSVFRLNAGSLADNMNFLNTSLTQPDTGRRRPVQTSVWYDRRLTIHRYGSYAMLPLFVTQFVLGNKLISQKEDLYATPPLRSTPVSDRLRNTHAAVAGAVGALFIANTTTGVWNYLATRHNIEGRKLRSIHALTMLLADAGFAYTGYLGSQATDHGINDARRHRAVGLTSFGIATAGASVMWFRRD